MNTEVFTVVALAIPLFAVTNIDDIFVLLGFFADRRFRTREVVVGQLAGIGLLVAVSVIVALAALVLPAHFVGLLGLLPIAIGVQKLIALRKGEDDAETPHAARGVGVGNIFSVSAVTVANGGDNVGVYAPVFALRSPVELWVIAATFLAMTMVWCGLSYWMVNHPRVGAPIRKYGHSVLPIVLIAIGVTVLHEGGTLDYVWRRFA